MKHNTRLSWFGVLAVAFTLPEAYCQTNPAWWLIPPPVPPPGTTNPPAPISGTPLPKAVANVGQLKYIAYCATQALKARNPALGAQVESALVGSGKPIPSWDRNVSNLQPFAAVNIGQLKAVAAPFYSVMHSAYPPWVNAQLDANGTRSASEPSSIFPWSTTAADDQNKAIATVGQLKAVFALRFEQIVDVDNDGMMDSWEVSHGFNSGSSSDASLDFDGDGVTNLNEYRRGTHPKDDDTDGDGMPDGWEYDHGFNGLNSADAAMDEDGDTISNLDEYLSNTDPLDLDSDDDGLYNFAEVDLGASPVDADTDKDGISDSLDSDPLIPATVQSVALTLMIWSPN